MVLSFGIENLEGLFEVDFSCGRIHSIADVDPNVFGEVFILEWNLSCDSRLDTATNSREILDGLAPPRVVLLISVAWRISIFCGV